MSNCGQYHRSMLIEEYEKVVFKAVGVFLLLVITLLSIFFIDTLNLRYVVAIFALFVLVWLLFSVKKMAEVKRAINWEISNAG